MARTLVCGSGWLLACPHEPDEGRREGSLVKFAAAPVTAWVIAAPKLCLSRQVTGVGAAGVGASAGAPTSAPCRRRERPRGAALKPHRNFSQGRVGPRWA